MKRDHGCTNSINDLREKRVAKIEEKMKGIYITKLTVDVYDDMKFLLSEIGRLQIGGGK